MNLRRLFVPLAVLWGVLAVGFALDASPFQAVVAALTALASLLLWWYTTRDDGAAA